MINIPGNYYPALLLVSSSISPTTSTIWLFPWNSFSHIFQFSSFQTLSQPLKPLVTAQEFINSCTSGNFFFHANWTTCRACSFVHWGISLHHCFWETLLSAAIVWQQSVFGIMPTALWVRPEISLPLFFSLIVEACLTTTMRLWLRKRSWSSLGSVKLFVHAIYLYFLNPLKLNTRCTIFIVQWLAAALSWPYNLVDLTIARWWSMFWSHSHCYLMVRHSVSTRTCSCHQVPDNYLLNNMWICFRILKSCPEYPLVIAGGST